MRPALTFYCKYILDERSKINGISIPQHVYWGRFIEYKFDKKEVIKFVFNSFAHSSSALLFYLYRSFAAANLSLDMKLEDFDININNYKKSITKGLGYIFPIFLSGFEILNSEMFVFIAAGSGRMDLISDIIKYHYFEYINNGEKIVKKGIKIFNKIYSDILLYYGPPLTTIIYTAAASSLIFKNIDILEVIKSINDECKDILISFLDVFIQKSSSLEFLSLFCSDSDDNTSIFNYNLSNYIKKVLKYKIPLCICKSIDDCFISYWELTFLHNLPCECGGIYHRERAWNSPPGR